MEKPDKMKETIEESASVLIVDDEPEVLAVIQEMLEYENYKLFQAASVEEAKNVLRKENVNIILTDLLLGDGSGSDVLEEAKDYIPTASPYS